MLSAAESDDRSPASERICPVITPTTPASTNVASSVPSRATIRPRDVGRRVMRTSRPGVRCGRIASEVHAIRQTAFSFSPTMTSWSAVVRAMSPTRRVWKVTSSGTLAFRGSGEAFGRAGCVRVPGFASSERSVISSAMRGSRSMKPAGVTCAFASSVSRSHIDWKSDFCQAAAYWRAIGSAGGGPGSHALSTVAQRIVTAATRPRLIPSGLTLAARIRATCERSVRLDRDRLRAPGDLVPISEHRDLVALRRQRAADRLGIPALHLQCAPRVVIPTGLLDRLLHIHAEVDESHRELEVRLHLRVAPRRTEDESRHRAFEREDGVEGVHRPFAWRERIWRPRIEREPGETVIEQDPGAGHDRRGAKSAEHALDQRDRIAVAIDHREVRRVGRRHQRPRLGAFARLGADGAAAARDKLRVQQATRVEVDPRGISSVRVAIRERELLCLHHQMDELRASPLERSHVETLDDGELLEKDVTLRYRRLFREEETAGGERARPGGGGPGRGGGGAGGRGPGRLGGE